MSDLKHGAYVTEVDGKLALVDPMAAGMIQAVNQHNCKSTMEAHRDRVTHFVGRVAALSKTPQEVVITLINVDTEIGRPLADALMPGFDWQAIRDRGEIPYARGLAGREGIQDYLDNQAASAAAVLRTMDGLAVIVVDHDTAAVFPAS